MFYFIFFTALLLFTTTCGIPNVYVPSYGTSSSSDIQITRDSDSGKFSITLSQTIINELSDNKPTLYFFYTISSSSQSSAVSSLLSTFNNNYAVETSGSIISSSNPISTYESGSGDSKKEYNLYQLTNSSGNRFSYDMGNDDSSSSFTLTLDSSSNTLTLTNVTNSSVISQNLVRYGNIAFTRSAGSQDITDYSPSETYYVEVYLVISCQFDNYSNTYNTKLEKSYPILKFQLSD